MSLVGFKAQNHPQQTGKRGRKESVDDRGTTREVFDPLHERFGFTLDVAASAHNAKCDRYLDREADGLATSWDGERVWCNPPYSDIRPWVDKAWASDCPVIVMLLPANRTEQGWWQDLVEPFRDRGDGFRVEFLRGRIRFIRAGATEVGPNERPPFGCCLLICTVGTRCGACG
jgi:phage N-6-adenine-methyltransferase